MATSSKPPKQPNKRDLASMLKTSKPNATTAHPYHPSNASTLPVYKLKNELRNLHETMNNPDYIKELFTS
jgi:hypothetical protein